MGYLVLCKINCMTTPKKVWKSWLLPKYLAMASKVERGTIKGRQMSL
jgi:hypothetical protein